MPVTRQVRRVANPRKTTRRKASSTATRRRKLTRKQKLAGFGGKRMKAAAKARHKPRSGATRKRNVAARKRATPRKRAAPRKAARRRTRSNNPALVLTLGPVNPRKRSKPMARRKTKRRSTRAPARKHRRRTKRRNPVYRTRRRATRRRRAAPVKRRRARRRNPSLFGSSVGGAAMAQSVLGGLVGVAAAKFLPGAVPIRIGGGNIVRVLVSGVAAVIAGWAAGKFIGRTFGDAVLFGGLMQTGSVALNAFLPALSPLALSGLNDLVDTSGFVVPQNPVLAPAAVPVNSRITTDGLTRSFGNAF